MRKETVDRDILIASTNRDRKVTQPNKISSGTILQVHFFQELLTNIM